MPYTLIKTNGAVLTTVDDATLNVATDLFFVGKNYAGYGNAVNENFVKLLENFSNSTAPTKPISGQLWFNSSSKSLNVYDGSRFKGLANIFVQSNQPSGSSEGDLWWDTTTLQLKTFDGSNFQLIGPTVSPSQKSIWLSVDEPTQTLGVSSTVLEATFAGVPIVTVSDNTTFVPNTTSKLDSTNWPQVVKGITLPGANIGTPPLPTSNSVPGSTRATGYYFWGTAAEALYVANVAGGQRGQILIQSDPDTTSFITLGASNSVLVSNGTTATFTAIGPFISSNLPIASNSALGGVKVGTNLTIGVDGLLSSVDTNTTYTFGATVASGGANLRLTAGGSGSGNQDIKLAAGAGIEVDWTDAHTITIKNTSANVTFPASAPGALTNNGSGGLSWKDVVSVHAYQSVVQTVPNNQITSIVIDQIFDNYPTTAVRNRYSGVYYYNNNNNQWEFHPGKAGFYQLNLSITFAGTTNVALLACGFGLNYTGQTGQQIISYTATPNTANEFGCVTASAIIFLNSTDFIVPLCLQDCKSSGLATIVDANPALVQRTTFSALGHPIAY
jgi:hypothetical protein